MLRKLSGYRTYSRTAIRITSGDELKYRNELAGLRGLGIDAFYPAPCLSPIGALDLTAPF